MPPSAITESISARSSRPIVGARRIARGNRLETLLEPLAPIQNRRGIEVPDLLVEQAILVAIGSDKAARVAARQVGHHFRQHLKPDEEAMERILVELIGAGKQLVEQSVLARHVTDQKRLRQLALVPEMIEEAALGDADRRDQLLDRGRGEALLRAPTSRPRREGAPACRCPFAASPASRLLSLRPVYCTTGTVENAPKAARRDTIKVL